MEDTAPVWDINEWISSDPRWVELMNTAGADYPNVFFPVQEEPTSGFPYVRFSASVYMDPENFWFRKCEIMYAMYFYKATHSNRALNIIADKVSAGDMSGNLLEQWRREKAQQDDIYNAYTYHSAEWVAGGSTQPTEERGGAHARTLTFRVRFSPQTGTHIV